MTDQPNILFITDDQHRWDFFGGAVPSLRTPNLDRLRARGTTLTNCYSVCPICMPARFSWCYGLYPSQGAQRLLANAHDWPRPESLRSMPQALQKAGYHTAMIGKVHSHSGLYSHDITVDEWETAARGFDDVFEVCGKSLAYWYDCRWTHYLEDKDLLNSYRQDLKTRNSQLGGRERFEASFLQAEDSMDAFIGRKAVDWIEKYQRDKPFFLHASLCGPHFPLDPPRAYFEHYQPDDMPSPAGVDDEGESLRWRQMRALYCGLIELVDDQVGRIMDSLQRRGWSDNTVVVFCTDHGDMIGDLGRNHKSLWHDASCRTPVTISYPETVAEGVILDHMVESVDLPCTFLEIAGSDPCRGLPQTPGQSFWKILTGGESRSWAYSECGIKDRAWRMVCDKTWKFVWHASEGEMLFHREDDPHDAVNRAEQPSSVDVLNLMKGRLVESMAACVAPNTVPFFATGEV